MGGAAVSIEVLTQGRSAASSEAITSVDGAGGEPLNRLNVAGFADSGGARRRPDGPAGCHGNWPSEGFILPQVGT